MSLQRKTNLIQTPTRVMRRERKQALISHITQPEYRHLPESFRLTLKQTAADDNKCRVRSSEEATTMLKRGLLEQGARWKSVTALLLLGE